jgi:hypothetical protein
VDLQSVRNRPQKVKSPTLSRKSRDNDGAPYLSLGFMAAPRPKAASVAGIGPKSDNQVYFSATLFFLSRI